MKIKIGSRGSDLALWQANFVKDQLENLGHEVSIEIIVTKGDKIQDLSFDKMEGKGFFTKEIEEALLSEQIDLAVHSHKDLETSHPEGLTIAAVSYRENPSDVLLIRNEGHDDFHKLELKENAKVGTSSARRRTQLLLQRPDLNVIDLRGNVPTRINKLREGQYDAIVLAAAGIARLDLDLSDLTVYELSPSEFVPAPAQGVLGYQIREKDQELYEALQAIHNSQVAENIAAERSVLRMMEGGCQMPLGVFCFDDDGYKVICVSFAKSKQDPAIVSCYESESLDGLPEMIVYDLKRLNEQ